MRAAVISGGEIAPAERPDPEPGDSELLVRVMSAGLNGADIGQRAGRYPPPDGSADPMVPGLEIAGQVIAVGERVSGFGIGDRVMGIVPGGGQAELCRIHERHALAVPSGIDLVAAGGFPEVFCTAYDALFTQAQLSTGERLLVNGAAGGVGVAAVQLAIAVGAEVIASVRHEPHRAPLEALGATALDQAAAFDAGPFDVILELVGSPNVARDLEALSIEGRITVIGTGAGARFEMDLSMLMRRRARIHGSMLRARTLEEKALVSRRIERHVLPLFAAGKVTVPIEAAYPLDEVGAAYDRFIAGAKLGKILLLP